MIKVIEHAMTGHFDQRHANARRVSTFIMGRWDTIEEQLKKLREAPLYFHGKIGRADQNLLDMPVLLLVPDREQKNRVFVKSPAGPWVEVTNATAEEIGDIAMGLSVQPVPPPPKTSDDSFSQFLAALFGVALCATAEGLSTPRRRGSLDRRIRW